MSFTNYNWRDRVNKLRRRRKNRRKKSAKPYQRLSQQAFLERLEDRQMLTTVSLEAFDDSATEGDPTDWGRFELYRTDATGSLTVSLHPVSSAPSGTDYLLHEGSAGSLNEIYPDMQIDVTFADGESYANFDVEALADNDTTEANEFVYLYLADPGDGSYTVDSMSNSGQVDILEGDPLGPVVSLYATDSSATEGDPMDWGQIELYRTDATGSLTVGLYPNNATSGSDYLLHEGSAGSLNEIYPDMLIDITFADGEHYARFDVEALADNNTVESGESVLFYLANSSDGSYIVNWMSHSGQVDILEGDPLSPVVSLQATDSSATEGDPMDWGQIELYRTDATGSLTVSLYAMNNATSGTDYLLHEDAPGSLNEVYPDMQVDVTFADGEQYVQFDVEALADNDTMESGEFVYFYLSDPGDGSYTVDSMYSSAQVDIYEGMSSGPNGLAVRYRLFGDGRGSDGLGAGAVVSYGCDRFIDG